MNEICKRKNCNHKKENHLFMPLNNNKEWGCGILGCNCRKFFNITEDDLK